MRYLAWLAIVATLLGLASTQCLSPNDNPNTTYVEDLSPINDFGFNLFRRFAPATSGENFFFSPYSIWTALVLAYFGTDGETQRQLENALNLKGKMSTYNLWRDLEEGYDLRQAQATGYTFAMANRLYLDHSLQVRPCIQDKLHREIERLDFSPGQHFQAADTINGFSSTYTKGLIPLIVTPADVQGATMVLANTAYFKGTWVNQFKSSKTQQEDFLTHPEAQPQSVPMMKQTEELRSGSFNQIAAKVLELPYSGEAMSMFLLLPLQEGPQGWDNMMSKLNVHSLKHVTDRKNLDLKTVELQMPKFKMEQDVQGELKQALMYIGIHDIFNSIKVDLSRFGNLRNVTLDKIIHKAVIEVNEEGAEAAAATAIVFVTRSGAPRAEPTKFYFNRPFLFLIYDNNYKNVVFMGAYKKPAAAQP